MYKRALQKIEAYINKPIPHEKSFLCECNNCVLVSRKTWKRIMKEIENE